MSAFREDFFAVEPLLLARLKEKVTAAKVVLSSDDLDNVDEKSQITPAVHVVFSTYAIRGDEVEQLWMVVAASKSLKQPTAAAGNTQRINSAAGQMVSQIIDSLRGFTPLPGECQPFAIAAPPATRYQNGFMYVPTVWSVKFTYTRERR